MPAGSVISSVLWFIAILALIPIALWLLKRTPAGGASAQGLMRSVAVLPLAPNQKLVTVEVGRGESRRWLVLGVTGERITNLHEMAPQDEGLPTAETASPFSQLLARFQHPHKGSDAR
jgi:flagellar protein FliO/FliZ